MTKTISVLLWTACAALALPQASSTPQATDTPSRAKAPAGKIKPGAKPTAPLTIPSRAVKQPDGSYRFVDEKGKAWLYQQTPFGVSRAPETAAAKTSNSVQTPFGVSRTTPAEGAQGSAAAKPGPAKEDDDHVTAVADGELIRFERPTPFGKSSWQKSKSDLTPEEQRIWDREQAKRNQ